MTAPWYSSGGVEIRVGHVLDVLAAMEPESVQTCVTSPPYYGLRSYSTTPQIWGGSPDCDHQLPAETATGRPPRNHNGQGSTTLHETGPHGTQPHGAQETPKLDAQWDAWQASAPGKVLTGGTGTASAKQVTNAGSQYGNAWTEQTSPRLGRHAAATAEGLEGAHAVGNHAVPADRYVPSATCTRCGAWRGELGSEPLSDCGAWARGVEPCSACFVCHLVTVFRAVRRVLHPTGTCWVNLGDSYSADHAQRRLTMPEGQVNWGLQSKTVGSRARDTHGPPPGLGPKQLMMLPARVALALQADGWVLRSDIIWSKPNPMPESVTDRPTTAHEHLFLLAKRPDYYFDNEAIREPASNPLSWDEYAGRTAPGATWASGPRGDNGQLVGYAGTHKHDGGRSHPAGRNRRSVWTIPTESYEGAHFATFPRKLVEPCVLAGSKPGDTVLDPFAGSGTTLWVARQHFRRAIGVELSPDYAQLAADRLKQSVLPFVEAL